MVRGMRVLFLYIFSVHFVTCQEWQKISKRRDAVYKIMNLDVYNINISVELPAASLLQCSYKCQRRSSLSFYYMEMDGRCFCNNATDSSIDDGDSSKPEVFYGVFRSEEEFKYQNHKRWLIVPEGYDCRHYYLSGYGTDGVYSIKPKGTTGFEVWCDMSNGGWTVFQNRYDGSVDFNRNWGEHRDGFGEMTREFWLGLQYLHYLASVPSEVWMEMTAFQGQTPRNAFLKLSNVTVGGSETNYILTHGRAVSDCTNSLSNLDLNQTEFSTPDADNDRLSANCASALKSGWWFSQCFKVYLNAVYDFTGLKFTPCWGHDVSIKESRMKILIERVGCNYPPLKPPWIKSCYLLCMC